MAEVVNIIDLAGQSNAQGQGVKGWPVIPRGQALEYNLSELIDWADTNDGMRSTIFPAFAEAMLELDGGKWCVLKTAGGGSSLLPEPVFTNGDWSPSGTFRSFCVGEINEAIAAINAHPDYTLGKVMVWWAQGEADGGYIELGEPGFSGENYKNALPVLVDYIKDNINAPLDAFYVTQLGATTTGENESGFAEVRQAQVDACDIRSDMNCFYLRTKDYPGFGWMKDPVHWNQLGLNDQGLKLAEFIEGAQTQKLEDSIFTETISIDDCIGYYKFNGDGKNNIVIPSASSDMSLVNTASYETATLFQTGVPNQDQFISSLDTNETSWGVISPSPITHGAWTISVKLFIPTGWDGSSTAFWGDSINSPANMPNNSGHHINSNNNNWIVEYFESGSNSTRIISANDPSDKRDQWLDIVESYDGVTGKMWVNGVLVASGLNAFTSSSSDFIIGNGVFNEQTLVFDSTPNVGMIYDHFRIYNRALSDSEVLLLTDEAISYNIANTPITPVTPIITNQNNDDNIFEWTSVNNVELSEDNGVSFNDAVSPYAVNGNIPTGELQIRVKAEGVNPVSPVAVSTINYTIEDELIYTKVTMYAVDNTDAREAVIKVRLMSNTADYKSNVNVTAETLEKTPDVITGLVEFDLIETDNMSGTHFYIFDFGNVAYKAQVPNVGEVNFNDLVKTEIRASL